MIRTLLLVSSLLIGCQTKVDGRPAAGEVKEPAAKTSETAPAKVVREKVGAAKKTQTAPPPQARKRKSQAIKWVDSLPWKSWEEAQSLSATQGKPIMLLIYTNWCPRCRELAPLFTDESIVKASDSFILVRQDQDERPAWLSQFSHLGGYVPRIIFFGADGQPREDVTSGRGKYPYFYTPRSQAALARSMAKAAKP